MKARGGSSAAPAACVQPHMDADRVRTPRTYSVVIRILDVLVAGFIVVGTLPLMLALACIVRLTSPGPVLFRQTRVGLNRRSGSGGIRAGRERRRKNRFGRPFTFYKFRSMVADARERFPELYRYEHSREELHSLPIKILVGPKDAVGGTETGEPAAIGDAADPRVTWIGRWLRRTSLDELPNFINVLKGDMHLVGPRPDIYENIRYYPSDQLRKLDVKPGVTGLAQIRGRGKLSLYETNIYDVAYVKNRSLWTDIVILLKTVPAALSREGAS